MEMVGSVDELKSSRSIAGKHFPNVEMLDARIASAFKRRSGWRNRTLRKRIGFFLLSRFSITLRNDNVQDFDTRWDEILLSMTKIPPDDVLESLYKLRIRESAQLKTVLEVYDMEIHLKISMPLCSFRHDEDKRAKTTPKNRSTL